MWRQLANIAPETSWEIGRVRRRLSNNRDKPFSTIYRLPPEILSRQNASKHAYRPKVVCIGPYHSSSNDKGLKSMQDHKDKCVKKLASKHGITDFEGKWLAKMEELEERARTSYSEKITLDRKKLARMLMLDGCFILDLLLDERSRDDEPDEHDEKVIGRLWIWSLVRCDLLLLENQIPFFVLQELYEILKTRDDDGRINLVRRALEYFSRLDPCRKGRSLKSYCTPPADSVHHLLHLIYQSILPCPHLTKFRKRSPCTTIEYDWDRAPPLLIPRARELQAAGVTFKERKLCQGSSFLDIKFSADDGAMEIPRLEVHDYSESLFRNLIAFEQCYPLSDFFVTAYAAFMDCLISTDTDFMLLEQKGILTFRTTGDKSYPRYFYRCLSKDVHRSADRDYLDAVFRDVNEYKDSRWWRRFCAGLVRSYDTKPWWKKLALTGAIVLFVSTLIQAIFSVISYFHPPK